MSDKSKIEWTDATWNPVRGCSKVSPGCKKCYAETFAERWRGIPGHPFEQGFDLRLVPEALGIPHKWRAPRRIFVNSMSDTFHEDVPNEYIASIFGVMLASRHHTFQVLTKRADRLPEWYDWLVEKPIRFVEAMERAGIEELGGGSVGALSMSGSPRLIAAMGAIPWPLPNVHLGVSVEDRKYGLPRIEHLRAVPAALRFLSIEPLLEDLGTLDLRGIGWVIVGGESGGGAREMAPEWVRSIRDQCQAAGVPFFFKQWGGVRKKLAGRLLDGRTWDEMPHAQHRRAR